MEELREIAEQNEILRIVNGSKLYGTDVESSDDDFQAIFLEPIESVFMRGKMETVQLRDKPEGVRSEAGDVDCTAYSLRHFSKLAAGGNPSVLSLLSAPDKAVVSESWIANLRSPFVRELFASQQAGPRFKGYMHSQKQRLIGEKKGHVPNRPELVDAYGFDVKYANHVVRLGIQGIEYMTTGEMTLPMKKPDRELLLAIRGGWCSLEEVMALVEEIEADLLSAISSSPLPLEPNYRVIAGMIHEIQEEFWTY